MMMDGIWMKKELIPTQWMLGGEWSEEEMEG
jgi:hypothetical protein